MTDHLRELYQTTIIDHGKHPRNHFRMEDASCCAQGHNPLCGDRLTLYLKLNHDTVEAVSFEGQGCAISQASASLMTEQLRGKSIAEVKKIFAKVHLMLTDEPCGTDLGKLAVLSGVREFPARVKCASLAWHTLISALEQSNELVKTED
jgi:nitrogen fixation protein NifU and related proteins